MILRHERDWSTLTPEAVAVGVLVLIAAADVVADTVLAMTLSLQAEATQTAACQATAGNGMGSSGVIAAPAANVTGQSLAAWALEAGVGTAGKWPL